MNSGFMETKLTFKIINQLRKNYLKKKNRDRITYNLQFSQGKKTLFCDWIN